MKINLFDFIFALFKYKRTFEISKLAYMKLLPMRIWRLPMYPHTAVTIGREKLDLLDRLDSVLKIQRNIDYLVFELKDKLFVLENREGFDL